MLYTRKGDGGTSGLFGTKERIPKDENIFSALGTVDELNSLLGVLKQVSKRAVFDLTVYDDIERVQQRLFLVLAELAGSRERLVDEQLVELEEMIAGYEASVQNPHSFVVPGATEFSAYADHARTVARRAEREVVHASYERPVTPSAVAYLNRLSSFLYALARYAATTARKDEPRPTY